MPIYVRVKDRSTGHQFDVPDSDPRIGSAFDLINDAKYPPSQAPRIRKFNPLPSTAPAAGGRDESSPETGEDELAEASAEANEKPARSARGSNRKPARSARGSNRK